MATKKVKSANALKKMKVEELVEFGMREHGLVFDTEKESKTEIIEMILSAQDDNGDETPPDTESNIVTGELSDGAGEMENVQDLKSPKKSEEANQKAVGEKRIWLRIFNAPGPSGELPVFLGCSGDAILVKREKWVNVKQKHINILDSAVETHFEDRVPRPVRRYRFEKSATKPDDAED